MVTFAPDPPAHDASAPRVVDLRPAPPAWMHSLLFLLWMGLGGYWWHTFSGPYRWLAEWQMSISDGHYPGLSVGIPVAVGWVASEFVLSRVLGTRMLGRDGESPLQTLESFKRLAPLAILAVGAVIAASWNRQAADAGTLLAATPADLSAHARKAGLYLSLTGVADARMAETDGDVYFAMRQVGADPASPALAVVAVREHEMQQLIRQNPDATVTMNGLAARDMDASLRRFFSQQGVRLADDPWLVRTWQTPDSLRESVRFLLGLAAVMAAVVAVLQAREARKAGARA